MTDNEVIPPRSRREILLGGGRVAVLGLYSGVYFGLSATAVRSYAKTGDEMYLLAALVTGISGTYVAYRGHKEAHAAER